MRCRTSRQAGEALEAAQWHHRAARWAADRDWVQSATHWRKVRELAATLPPSRETHRLGALACARVLYCGSQLGLPEEEAAEVFEEGKALAHRGEDLHRLADLLSHWGVLRMSQGAVSEACESVAETVALAERAGDERASVNALVALLDAYKHAGRLHEVEVLVDRLEQSGSGALLPEVRAIVLRTRGDARLYRGCYRAAERDLEETIRSGRAVNVSLAHCHYAALAELTGEVEIARSHALRGLELARQIGTANGTALAYACLGICNLLRAEWREAADSLERCLTLVRERRAGLQREAWYCASLAEAYLGLGDREHAQAVAETGIGAGRKGGAKLWEARSQLSLARVLLHGDAPEPDRAGEALGRAEELIAETGGRAYQPFVHEERAHLARLGGNEAEHGRELREAHRLYTEMGATGHAERVRRELAELEED